MTFPSAAERCFFTLHSPFFTYFLPLLFHPVIIVFHNHEDVALRKFLIPVKHHIANALVEDVGTLVTASHDDGVVQTHMMITIGKRLYEFGSRHLLDVGEFGEMDFRKLRNVIVRNHLTNHRGIIQNARLFTLAEHLVQVAFINRQAVTFEHGSMKGRRFLLADRWQLRLVPNQHQAVVMTLINEMNQIIQQTATSESSSTQSQIGNHRSLIHHEERIRIEIVVEIELAVNARKCFLAIDAAMDGEGRRTAAQGEDLGSPARRSQEHHLLTDGLHRADDGTRKRSLTRTRTTPQYHHSMRIAIGHEAGEDIQRIRLFGSWRKAKLLQYLIF